jgi:hypothetical protein
MNRPLLRLTRPGQLPAPATGDHSLPRPHRSDQAPRPAPHPYWLGDSAIRPHALTSLIAQAGQLLPQAVHDARVGPHTLPPNRARYGWLPVKVLALQVCALCACGLS